jgi:HlyD family secretion protein
LTKDRKTWATRSGAVVVVLIAATALYARGREPDAGENSGPEFQAAEHRSIEVTAEAAGLIEPIRLVEVKSKASGEILSLTVESGDRVRRGDLLGQVDPRDVRNAFEQARADLEVAEARMATAESQRRRSTELRAANVITEQEFESAKLEEANARAQLIKARVNLELAQERLGDVTIRAPIDGVIIRKDIEVGGIIQSASQNISGGTTIFLMADLNEMQVRTLVDETDLGKIQPGQTARVSVDAFPGRTFIGTVNKIEPQAVVEQNVTMFPVLVQLDNSDGALRPGMNGEVVIEVARKDNVVTIPNAAIVGMRDAVAAGALFGLNEETMRGMMRGGAGGGAAAQNGGASPNGPAAQGGAAAPGVRPDGAATPGAAAADGPGRPDSAAAGARPAGATAQGAPAAQGAPPTRQGAPGGAMQRGGQGGQGGPGAMGGGARGNRGGIGGGDTRMGVVFVRTETGVEPRTVVLGLNDWEYTEVIRGIEPGEEVVMISVARLQQQQQDMLNRMRQNNSGPFPGAGGPGGGPGRR